jgi:hypothetical protein
VTQGTPPDAPARFDHKGAAVLVYGYHNDYAHYNERNQPQQGWNILGNCTSGALD